MQTQNVRTSFGLLIKITLLTLLMLVVFIMFSQAFASAQEPQQTSSSEATSETVTVDTTGDDNVQIIPDSYQYVVVECDNMSKLVRRSILLYDQADDTISLTPAQVMFVETNIVQNSQPRLLDIGEGFEVARSQIENYISLAPGLTQSQLNAWDAYASTATFELNYITPTNVPLTEDGDLDENYTPVTETETADESADESGSNASAYWWIVGLGVVVVLAFLLWPNDKKE